MDQHLIDLYNAMVEYERGCPSRIQHFMKVRDFASMISIQEGLDESIIYTLNAACLVHDIGIKEALIQFGKCTGKMQEELGPNIAREMMTKIGFSDDVISRACYLVSRHHTYTDIDGLDYQILLEADALVNLYEGKADKEKILSWYENVFKTETGKQLCKTMFDLKGE